MGKLTINLCEELHQKIREDVAADESLTTSLLMERIIREHYEGPKPRPRIESGGRTMAFSVSEELFQRVKRYLAAHGGQSQRDFVIGLVTQGLALWEQGKALKMLEGYTPQKGDRTLAFAVTEELFHQIKAYLAAHKKLSQKEFMVSLVENAVSAWEAGAEADGSPIVEVLPELTEEEKRALCSIAREVRPDFIKTSTGFGTGGATFEDVALMRKYVGANVKVKAAGGIASFADAEKFVELGADRLGTSRLIKIMKAENAYA